MPGGGKGQLFHGDHADTGHEHEEEENEGDEGKVVEQDAVVAAQGTEQTLGGKGRSGHGFYTELLDKNH